MSLADIFLLAHQACFIDKEAESLKGLVSSQGSVLVSVGLRPEPVRGL